MARTKKAEVKQNPQLRERELAGGKIALYLEYYLGRSETPRLDENGNQMYYQSGKMAGKPMYVVKHNRRKEELKLYLTAKPRTPEERQANKDTKLKAEAIRQEREQQRLNDTLGYRVESHKADNIISFFDSYVEAYTKKDVRNMALAVNRFKTFLREREPMPGCFVKKKAQEIAAIQKEWEEKHKDTKGHREINENEFYSFKMLPGQFTQDVVEGYKDYLIEIADGEGAATSFKRFKKMIKAAFKQGILKTNPCVEVKCPPVDENAIKKDILTSDEISRLIACHYPGENKEIQRAFVFSLFTGVRWVDVRALRFGDIDYTTSTLTFTQKKTEGHSAHAEVTIPLRADLLQLIGTPDDNGKTKADLIFTLPSHTMCNKALSHWAKRAGIEKHITWHCGRHSFATNVLANGANIKVVADLLGHANLAYVERYTRVLDEQKSKAVNSLPAINLQAL